MATFDDLVNSNNDIDQFSLDGVTIAGKVVDCYDADTCKINIILNEKLVKYTCRLYGIDTPEMKPKKDIENRDEEIMKAHKAKNYLLSQILHNKKLNLDKKYSKKETQKMLAENKHLVTVKCGEFDKYGRLLAEIYEYNNDTMSLTGSQTGGSKSKHKSYNEMLIKSGYAYAYFGGTKK